MAVKPTTRLKLLKCPLLLDNKNQLTFASKEAQFNYFNSLPKIEIEEISYIRKENAIYFDENVDSLLQYNYCIYQNENYGNKWFYAFITNMEYIADETTRISIATDVFQTWQFDINFKKCFVEREMINVEDDLIGYNRINESLETGEYVIDSIYPIHHLQPYYVIAYVGDSIKQEDRTQDIFMNYRGNKLNGVYSGVAFILCNDDGFRNIMHLMRLEDNSNNILTIFTIPKFSVTFLEDESHNFERDGFIILNYDMNRPPAKVELTEINENTNFEGYTPINKKLLQYPFVYLGFNPNCGSKQVFRYEDFFENKPDFDLISEISPNPNIILKPNGYMRKNKAYGSDNVNIASITGYPTISYKNDTFNTWLAQNQDILQISMDTIEKNYQQASGNNYFNALSNGINTGFSVANSLTNDDKTGAIQSGITGGLNSAQQGFNQAFLGINKELNIRLQMAQVDKQRMLPDNAVLSGNNSTLLGYDLMDESIFTRYTIKKEVAKRIDDYFSMYGYLTNELKIPNLNNRTNWNYVKLTQANILANIPQQDLQLIIAIFETGVTLWHNPGTFLDYSQNNR